MSVHFGPRILGKEEFAKAQDHDRRTAGNHFGPRVVGQAAHNARAARSVPGPKLTPKEQPTDEGLSVEQLKAMLDENHTLLDTLYMAELARPDGARPEALRVMQSVELRTTRRPDVLAEFRDLLAAKAPVSSDVAERTLAAIKSGTTMKSRGRETPAQRKAREKAEKDAKVAEPPAPPPTEEEIAKLDEEELPSIDTDVTTPPVKE